MHAVVQNGCYVMVVLLLLTLVCLVRGPHKQCMQEGLQCGSSKSLDSRKTKEPNNVIVSETEKGMVL